MFALGGLIPGRRWITPGKLLIGRGRPWIATRRSPLAVDSRRGGRLQRNGAVRCRIAAKRRLERHRGCGIRRGRGSASTGIFAPNHRRGKSQIAEIGVNSATSTLPSVERIGTFEPAGPVVSADPVSFDRSYHLEGGSK
jgi:hypothetical protein